LAVAAPPAQVETPELRRNSTLFVATTRKPMGDARARPWFGTGRGRLVLARAVVYPPSTGGDLSVGVVTGGNWRIGALELISPGQTAVTLVDVTSGYDAIIFVHGFNQTFEAGALDAARLSDGIKFRGATVLFSWPSKAGLLDYSYDRESAMWSRDALEEVLYTMTSGSNGGRTHVVAHSMGSLLTLEALRQLSARQTDVVAGHIGAVVLAAPDVDLDVFRSTIGRIGGLAERITVITATNDRALAVSRGLAGGVPRVGAAEATELEKLGVRVVDASREGWGIINHDLFLTNANVRDVVRQAIERTNAA